MPLMPELPGSMPRADTLERAAALEGQAPDPAWIAAIANSLFKTAPGEPPPSGPGANLPSAGVYAVEPLMARIPRRFGIGAIGFGPSLRPTPPASLDLVKAQLQSRCMAMSR